MPTTRRRRVLKRRGRTGELTREERLYLWSGFNLLDTHHAFEGKPAGAIAEAWQAHGAEVLRDFVATFPCSRPWAWWQFEKLPKRRAAYSPDFLIDIEEPEYCYLKRTGLLGKKEEQAAADLEYLEVLQDEAAYWQRAWTKEGDPKPAGELVWKARKRNALDMADGHKRGLWFDADAARRVECFFHLLLRHAKGEWGGKPFRLMMHQRHDILRPIFGWMRIPEGMTTKQAERLPHHARRAAGIFRRFRRAYLEISRKGGKSTMLAGVGLYLTAADREQGAEVFCAATKRDQAKIVHGAAVSMRAKSPDLREAMTFHKTSSVLAVPATESRYEPLGGDGDTLDGLNQSGTVVDELHAHKTPEVWNKLSTGEGSRQQPLNLAITTAGDNRESICYIVRDQCVDILNGAPADEWFAYIATIDPADDYTDPACWVKANPGLGISPKLDYVADQVALAQRSPAQKANILRMHFNVWEEGQAEGIDMKQWDACSAVDSRDLDAQIEWRARMMAEMKGKKCSAALDIASVSDFTALCLKFRLGDRKHLVLPWFWIPRGTRLRDDARIWPLLNVWAEHGFLEWTDGNSCDYEFVRKRIGELSKMFPFHDKEIVLDTKFQAAETSTKLMEAGFEVKGFSQGIPSMTPPTRAILDAIADGQIEHGQNPVLRWHASNCIVLVRDNDLMKFARKSAVHKIDGMVAMAMSWGAEMARGEKKSVYEGRGALVF